MGELSIFDKIENHIAIIEEALRLLDANVEKDKRLIFQYSGELKFFNKIQKAFTNDEPLDNHVRHKIIIEKELFYLEQNNKYKQALFCALGNYAADLARRKSGE